MTKRYIVVDRWIKDNCIGIFLNIDFNTITDANLCCDLLNRIEKEKRDNGKIASKLLEENEQLKQILNELSNMLKFDVENGIRSYPVKLSEYLSNALKELEE